MSKVAQQTNVEDLAWQQGTCQKQEPAASPGRRKQLHTECDCVDGKVYLYLGTLLERCQGQQAYFHQRGPVEGRCKGYHSAVTEDKMWQLAVGLGDPDEGPNPFLDVVLLLEDRLGIDSPLAMAAWGRLIPAERQEALAGAIMEATG